MTTTIHYAGPVVVEVIGHGTVTVQRQGGIYAWEAQSGCSGPRVNDHAGSQILDLVLGGMALRQLVNDAVSRKQSPTVDFKGGEAP